MAKDLRKISCLAVTLLVVLRISIGWHLFYEGLWKLSTQKTASPWTAEGYLRNSTGPLRTTFRQMTGDPNDLRWLDYETMSAKWDAWRDRFVAHYGVDKKQLDRLLDGTGSGFSVGLGELPPGFDFDDAVKTAGVLKDAIKYDADAKRLTVSSKLHLIPSEQAKLIKIVNDLLSDMQADAKEKGETLAPEVLAPYEMLKNAINEVATRSSRLSFREQLAANLKGNTDRTGVRQEGKKDGETDLVVSVGDVEEYKDLIDRYEANYTRAKTKYQWDHIERQWSELQGKRRSLVAPIQALEKELFEEANKLLSIEQLAMGPLPEAVTEMSQINLRTMWGLIILGLLLMFGLFTRLSSLCGAALLCLFYMAMPPWPGVQELPSIEHNLIVNKVLVEVLALLAMAALPSGKWFGADAIISLRFRRRSKEVATKADKISDVPLRVSLAAAKVDSPTGKEDSPPKHDPFHPPRKTPAGEKK